MQLRWEIQIVVLMSSSLESHYPSIIRLLDVQVIGPYLVKRGVLSSQEYYDNYVGPLQKGETSNYKLSLKLATECLRKPNDFLEALEESLYDNGSHASHQELFEMMPYAANVSCYEIECNKIFVD